jgi:hypothetical protein
MVISTLRGTFEYNNTVEPVSRNGEKLICGWLHLRNNVKLNCQIAELDAKNIPDNSYVEVQGYIHTNRKEGERMFTYFLAALAKPLSEAPKLSGYNNFEVAGSLRDNDSLTVIQSTGIVKLIFRIVYHDDANRSIMLHCISKGPTARVLSKLKERVEVRLRGALDCKGGPIKFRVNEVLFVAGEPFTQLEDVDANLLR